MMTNKKYPINLLGEEMEFTAHELMIILTPSAYSYYWKVYFQGGRIEFGEGSLASSEFIDQFF